VARHQLRELGTQIEGPAAAFRDDLATLFQTQGLAAFPLLIVDGRIAFYGGVPSTETIELKLLSQPGSEQVRTPVASAPAGARPPDRGRCPVRAA
jgi:hypothetical protein